MFKGSQKVNNVTFTLIYTLRLNAHKNILDLQRRLKVDVKGEQCYFYSHLHISVNVHHHSEKVSNVTFTLFHTLRLNKHKNELHKGRKKVRIMSPLPSFTHFS